MAKEALFMSSGYREWVSFDKVPKTEYDWAMKLSTLLYHKGIDKLYSFQMQYIVKQINKLQQHGQFSEFVMEKLVLAYVS